MVQLTIVAPERSVQQRLDALERANEVRIYRARMKREIKRGERHVPAILFEPEAEVDTMKVFDLLMAMPKVGRGKANKWLARCRISPSKTIGGMTERQRLELVSLMTGRPLTLAA